MTGPTCRGCGANDLPVVLSLGEQPPANSLRSAAREALSEPRYPLDLAVCPECSLAQLTLSLAPEELFGQYQYFTSYSPTLVANAEALVRRLVREFDLTSGSLAMEIASNDGYLLQHYVGAGVPVLGIDPARNVVEAAAARGVETRVAFFGRDLARELRSEGTSADVIHANNVMAHVPDVNGVVAGLADVLSPHGHVVIETPYVRDLVDQLEFDTIYHEHLFYYSLTSLSNLLERHGLSVRHVELIPIHGTSLRVFVGLSDGTQPTAAVSRLLREEHDLGMDGVDYYDGFARRVDELRGSLRGLLDELRASGRRVAGYGAAAKASVLLNAIGAGPDTIEFVADRSPHKQGRFVPGAGIPIVPTEQLLVDRPDDVVLFAWNFADEILEQQRDFRASGGRFIIPLPAPTIV